MAWISLAQDKDRW